MTDEAERGPAGGRSRRRVRTVPTHRGLRTPPTATWRLRWPDTDDLAKLGAVASAILYGILFLAYRTYYSAVDIDPEDVGVSSGFVLVRSIGFVLITLAIATTVAGYILVSTGSGPWAEAHPGLASYAVLAVLLGALGYYFFSLFPPSAGPLPALLTYGALFALWPTFARLKRSRRYARHFTTAVVTAGVVLSVAAATLGEQARRGNGGHVVRPARDPDPRRVGAGGDDPLGRPDRPARRRAVRVRDDADPGEGPAHRPGGQRRDRERRRRGACRGGRAPGGALRRAVRDRRAGVSG